MKNNKSIDLTKAYQEASLQVIDAVKKAGALDIAGLKLTVQKILDTTVTRLDSVNGKAVREAVDHGKNDGRRKFSTTLSAIYNGRSFTAKDVAAAETQGEKAEAERIRNREQKIFKSDKVYRDTFIELRKELLGARSNTFRAVNDALKELAKTRDNTVINAKKAIAEKLAGQGVFQVKYRNGASVEMGAYASMVARTARTESANTVSIQLAKAHGTKLVRCVGNAVTCAICAQYRNRVFSVDGSDPRFPDLYEGENAPLRHGYQSIHPHCRCEFLPYFEELEGKEQVAKDAAFSSRPYTDDRSMRQKRDYQEWQAMNRQIRTEQIEYEAMKRALGSNMPYSTIGGFRRAKRAGSENYQETRKEYFTQLSPSEKAQKNRYYDSVQFAGYRKMIGKEAPETLDKFQDLKYNKPKEFGLLVGYRKAVEKGDISPLVGMKVYRETAEEVQTKLVGIEAANGVKIENYSTHFLDRVIGQYADSEYAQKGKRRGVLVEDVAKALSSPLEVKQGSALTNGETSIVFIGEKCKVSINPRTGKLIQTNPRSEK